MSFALSAGDSKSARLLPNEPRGNAALRPTASRPAAAPTTDEFARVREAIQEILRHAADIRKDARILSTAQKYTPSRRDLKESVRAARASAEEATRLLRALAPTSGGSAGEQNLRRLTHGKLAESLVNASNELESSWREYAAAEANWSNRVHEAHSGGQQAITTGSVVSDYDENNRTMQMQIDAQAVSEAEVDLHAAIVDEYTQDITQLARNVKDMREALMSLAEHTRSQGEVLDDIEMQMSQATDSTAGATQELVATSRHQWRATKWIGWLLLFALIMVVTIVAIVSQRH